MEKNIVVIGGGASGLVAAISAARSGAHVTVLERAKRIGSKILRTGNGRCNLSNTHIAPDCYNAPDFVEPVLDRYGPLEVGDFFTSLGLLTVTDEQGRVFPYSNDAHSVLDVLRLECARLDIHMLCEFDVIDVRPRPGTADDAPPFTLLSQSGTWVTADTLIVSTGDDFSLIPFLGHRKSRSVPALCPVATSLENIRGLSGVRARCRATLSNADGIVDVEEGELLFRDYGVSGIMVFDLSRFVQEGQTLSIDFFPEWTYGELAEHLEKRRNSFSWRNAQDLLVGALHPALITAVMRYASRTSTDLVEILKNFPVSVLGLGDTRQAQVTRGGAMLDEIDPQTLRSRNVPELYFTGETLDVDGRCGGFNLHWAWASGLVAGERAAGC